MKRLVSALTKIVAETYSFEQWLKDEGGDTHKMLKEEFGTLYEQNDFDGSLKEYVLTQFNEHVRLPNRFPVTLYRAICVDGNKIDKEKLGVYWTAYEKKASCGGDGFDKKLQETAYVLKIKAPKNIIDFQTSVMSQLTWEEEKEITLIPHSRVRVLDVKSPDGKWLGESFEATT